MTPKNIRILAIHTCDDDGGNSIPCNLTTLEDQIRSATQCFAPANVTFAFDPSLDYIRIASSLLNQDRTYLEDLADYRDALQPPKEGVAYCSTPHSLARDQLGRLFPDRLCVFFRYTTKVTYDSSLGHFTELRRGGSSGMRAACVNMGNVGGKYDLAHEIGHYLQLHHTFRPGIAKDNAGGSAVGTAAEVIRAYVEDQAHPADEGLDALDGDKYRVLDTPPDAAGAIFEEVYGQGKKCGPDGTVTIPVVFTDPVLGTRDYTLAPNRSLVMSYFKDCPGPKTISDQQATRVRDALEQGYRHGAVSLRDADLSGRITEAGNAKEGDVDRVSAAYVREGRLVTAVRTGEGTLKVIVWDVDEATGAVERKGDAGAGAIAEQASISCTYVGLSIVATTVVTSSNHMKAILWRILENGQVERLDSLTGDKVTSVASCRLGQLHLGLGFRRASDGKLGVMACFVNPNGGLSLAGEQTGDEVDEVVVAALEDEYLISYSVDRNHNGKTTLWRFADGQLAAGDSRIGKQASLPSAASIGPQRQILAFRDQFGHLRITVTSVNQDSVAVHGESGAGDVSQLSVCAMGVDHVITAVRDGAARLRVILWHVVGGVLVPRRRGHAVGGEVQDISVCRAGHRRFVTACRDGDGKLSIVAWALQSKCP